MTEVEYQAVKAKVLREFPVRQRLAKLADRKLGDETLLELWAMAAIRGSVTVSEACDVARSALKESTDR